MKATCWFAGFPLTNVEVLFLRNVSGEDTHYMGDARLRHFYLLEKWRSPELNRSLVRDFLGPSLDTGFRLASLSTPRKFVMSVEIAWFLATAQLPPGKEEEMRLNWFDIIYDGRIALKGVLAGKPYPVFWIDMHTSDSMARAEDALQIPAKYIGNKQIIDFCERFFEENDTLMMKPFIYQEEISQYGVIPHNYVESLNNIYRRWTDEKLRYDTEMQSQVNNVDAGIQEKMSADEVNIVVQEIIDKTEEK